jgi:hypothetical protein
VPDGRDFTLADPRANQVLQKLREEIALTTPWRFIGPPVQVVFPLAATVYEVQHLMGDIPDGVQVITSDARVIRAPGRQWTRDVAYLQSDTANSFAVLVFGVLREGVQSVSAT